MFAQTEWAMDWTALTWMFPPAETTVAGSTLRVVTGDQGDFWQETFYGFRHHNGHFLHGPATGDFTAQLQFRADFQAQYDQAGLMLRADEAHWIKCGIEFVGGLAHLAVVVTNGKSDWSQMPLTGFVGSLNLRLTRLRDAVWVQYLTGSAWQMVRLGYFPPDLPAQVGPMCCSPSRAGLVVEFEAYTLTPPISEDPY
jgi:uncharacterized protein